MSADEKRWRLICYDIREPKRYRRVHKIIKGHARRLQYSVFRSLLDGRELERLRWRLAKEMAAEDSLMVIDLCPRCAQRAIAANDLDGWALEPERFRVVEPPEQAPPNKQPDE